MPAAAAESGSCIDFRSVARNRLHDRSRNPAFEMRGVQRNRVMMYIRYERCRGEAGRNRHSGWPHLHDVRIFATSARGATERMSDETILAAGYWAVLTAVEAGAPYAVPVIYGWDGGAAYVLMQAGRKERALRVEPWASLTVPDGAGGSVLMRGRVEWLEELGQKVHAADVVRRQIEGRRAVSVRDAGRFLRARVIRLVPTEVLRLEVSSHPL